MAVTFTAPVVASSVKPNRKANRAKASAAPASKPAAPAPFSTPANCATLNVNPAVIDYSAWRKDALCAEYRRRFPTRTLPKSTKATRLVTLLTNNVPTVPGMRGHKDTLREQYRAVMGVDAPKGWTGETLEDAIATKRRPGQRTANGGLRVADCRRLISAAVALGIVSKAQTNGRSKWKAAQLHEFVAKHNLTTMAVGALSALKSAA